METRKAPRRAMSGAVCTLVMVTTVVGAVLGATAGPVVRSVTAAEDSVQPCPEDGSAACAVLWFEYAGCVAGGGGDLCVVPCCSIVKRIDDQVNAAVE